MYQPLNHSQQCFTYRPLSLEGRFLFLPEPEKMHLGSWQVFSKDNFPETIIWLKLFFYIYIQNFLGVAGLVRSLEVGLAFDVRVFPAIAEAVEQDQVHGQAQFGLVHYGVLHY